ncbi:hypothetical protein PoB_007110000 [Plakobranchus ocellatus]|uniref:Uncharacterized protein n=1 Tax=Plakobranchus ocellatus TaxID=259542 RepID=A0AAV4DKQ2_9GAST|nr:hypothetical protein PoB_007110000 [Plakobranchus ocellatus]
MVKSSAPASSDQLICLHTTSCLLYTYSNSTTSCLFYTYSNSITSCLLNTFMNSTNSCLLYKKCSNYRSSPCCPGSLSMGKWFCYIQH